MFGAKRSINIPLIDGTWLRSYSSFSWGYGKFLIWGWLAKVHRTYKYFWLFKPLSTFVPNACCMLLFERNALYYRSLLKNWKSFLHSIGFAVSEPFLASRIEPACLFGCMCYVIPASIGGQEVGKKWGLKWVKKQTCYKTAGKIKNFLKTVHNYVFTISKQSGCSDKKKN